MYQSWRTANNDIDAALGNLEDGMKRSKQMAAVSGGNAAQALRQVADLLNSAGEALSDYDDVPATLEEFRKDFAARDENRLKSIDAAVSGLQEVGSASDILDDLSSNVPQRFKNDLNEITNDVADSADQLRQAIKLMGGKVPADDDDSGSGT
jgi:ABC-type transporter Mla subunit MlaD